MKIQCHRSSRYHTATVLAWRRPHGEARGEGLVRRRQCTRINAVDPSVTQDVIIGGAVAVSVGATLYFALSKEPEGSGIMDGTVPEEIEAEARRGSLGRNRSKNECRVCQGDNLPAGPGSWTVRALGIGAAAGSYTALEYILPYPWDAACGTGAANGGATWVERGGASSRLGYFDATSIKTLLMVAKSSGADFILSEVSFTALTLFGAERQQGGHTLHVVRELGIRRRELPIELVPKHSVLLGCQGEDLGLGQPEMTKLLGHGHMVCPLFLCRLSAVSEM
eukprot:jgi/Picre1/28283/NNA_003689.t1